MSKEKDYLKNTFVLLLGKFTTQFMSMLLLPIFTRYLLTSDYGLVDLYQTYISLFCPVFLLCLDSGVFRFLVDARKNDEEKSNIISASLYRLSKQIILIILLSIILFFFVNIKYYVYIVFNLIVLMISNVLLQISRGLGKNKNYSIASITTGFIILMTSIISIIVFKMHANSIFIANIAGNVCCSLYIFISCKIYKYISVKKFNSKIIKDIFKYSIPLIPNALSWWVVNVSDRTIISYFIGASANGIYTVSCKFSNILNGIFGIFTMSWQETASLHIDDSDNSAFFSKMINNIYKLFVSISALIIILVALFFEILIGKDYYMSYNYIPILVLANTFNVLIGLFGGIYIAKKMSKKLTFTTIISAAINLFTHIVLINFIGLYAACFSTLISFIVMTLYRYFDVQKIVKIKIYNRTICYSLILFIVSFLSYYLANKIIIVISLLFFMIFVFVVNKKMIIDIFKTTIDKFRR